LVNNFPEFDDIHPVLISGHLTGCGGADLHNSLTSTSSASSEHFPHKTGKNA